MSTHHFVELSNEFLHCGDKLNNTLGNEDCTIVHAHIVTLNNDIGNFLGNIMQSHFTGLNLLADDAVVGTRLQGTLQGDV